MNKMNDRLTVLEEEVKTLRAMTPLQAFTAGLKTASPEDIKEWMAVFQEMAGPLVPSVPSPSASESSEKPKKEKKKPTNAAGPTEWNVFLKETWISMAAEAGIIQSDFESEAVFRKEAAKAGITYQAAMTEASRRKALLEGKDPNAPKKTRAKKEKPASEMAAMKEKLAAGLSKLKKEKGPMVGGGAQPLEAEESQSVAEEAEESQSVAEESEEEEAEDAGLAAKIADAKEMGWKMIKIESVLHFLDEDTQAVYNTELDQVGEFVEGVYKSSI